MITVFTDERRTADPTRNPEGIGNLHHLAFTVSRATYTQIAKRLDERGISHTGEVDRGFMDSIYFRDPLGQLIECAAYKFEPPSGATSVDVLREAHLIRVAQGAAHIADEHLADAIELLTVRRQPSLSTERTAKDPYTTKPPVWG